MTTGLAKQAELVAAHVKVRARADAGASDVGARGRPRRAPKARTPRRRGPHGRPALRNPSPRQRWTRYCCDHANSGANAAARALVLPRRLSCDADCISRALPPPRRLKARIAKSGGK